MMKTTVKRGRIHGVLIAGVLVLLFASTVEQAVAGDFAAPIDDAALSAQRGREGAALDLTFAASDLNGHLSDNVAIGTNNGRNVIRDNAFSNLKGHATVIQNSGNNNIIQDSTIYNFSLQY